MALGLTNAPASFLALMNSVFGPYLQKFILVFFDNILICSKSIQEHATHLEQTLELMHQNEHFAKLSKCQFGQAKLEYLGHTISHEGVAADPAKVEIMLNWPRPQTLWDLRGFLRLTGYYRKFFKDYGTISRPLTALLKKGQFQRGQLAEKAFDRLKRAMTTTPVLAMPNFQETFVLETDASNIGIGAVLMQNEQAIAFLSKGLGPKNASLSTYEKEMLAIVIAVQKWRHYLSMNHYIIRTDHQALKYFLSQQVTTSCSESGLLSY